MTTPDGLTAESEALLAEKHWAYHAPTRGCVAPCAFRDRLAAIEQAAYEQGIGDGIAMEQGMQADALARHVRETGCDGLTVDRLAVALDFVDKRLSVHEQAAAILPALAPTVAASEATEVHGREKAAIEREAGVTADRVYVAYLAPSPATEAERRGGEE